MVLYSVNSRTTSHVLLEMSEKKSFSLSQLNPPFPYPLQCHQTQSLPFCEEGFLLIYASLDESKPAVVVNDLPAIIALIKMGFFGSNSNKHLGTLFYLKDYDKNCDQTKSNYSNGEYLLESFEIPRACTESEHVNTVLSMFVLTFPH